MMIPIIMEARARHAGNPEKELVTSTVEVRIALLEDVARSWLQPLFLATTSY